MEVHTPAKKLKHTTKHIHTTTDIQGMLKGITEIIPFRATLFSSPRERRNHTRDHKYKRTHTHTHIMYILAAPSVLHPPPSLSGGGHKSITAKTPHFNRATESQTHMSRHIHFIKSRHSHLLFGHVKCGPSLLHGSRSAKKLFTPKTTVS